MTSPTLHCALIAFIVGLGLVLAGAVIGYLFSRRGSPASPALADGGAAMPPGRAADPAPTDDPLAAFLGACCVCEPAGRVSVQMLHTAYLHWLGQHSLRLPTEYHFVREMNDRGFDTAQGRTLMFTGLWLKLVEQPAGRVVEFHETLDCGGFR